MTYLNTLARKQFQLISPLTPITSHRQNCILKLYDTATIPLQTQPTTQEGITYMLNY